MVKKQKAKKSLIKILGITMLIATTLPVGQSYAADGPISWLGTLRTADNYGQSWAGGVSADGLVVVGSSDTDGYDHAFRWAQGEGMTDLGTLPTTDATGTSLANGVSADGSVVVGQSSTNNSNDRYWRAFRWTKSGGMTDLGTLQTVDTNGDSNAYGVSADGSVVVGRAKTDNGYSHAFRWVQSGGMTDLGTMRINNTGWSEANGVSADGSVVAGRSETNNGYTHAFRWTQSDGMTDLGTLRTDTTGYSYANGVSANGAVVVGESDTDNRSHAFRWTKSGGMTDLGTLRTVDIRGYSWASAVNADGSVVVGASSTNNRYDQAFRWTQADGMITVGKWLENNGVANAQNLDLEYASGVSADGNVIVGTGYFNGQGQAYIARTTGIIGMQDFYNSITPLQSVNNSLEHSLQYSLTNTFDVAMFGQENFGISVNGDWNHDSNRSIVVGKRSVDGKLRYGVGYNHMKSSTDLLLNGEAYSKGNMFGSFIDYGLASGQGLQARLSIASDRGDVGINREYLAGNNTSRSKGNAKYNQDGIMIDVGYGKDISADTLITPHIGIISTKTEMEGYTEEGGSFPAQFGKRENANTYAKLGVNSITALGKGNVKLHVDINRMQHISGSNDPLTGQITGLSGFEQAVNQAKSFTEYHVGVDITLANAKDKNPAVINLGYTKRDGADVGKEKDTYSIGLQFGF